MNAGELVTISLAGPREKFWGVLLALNPTGATVRGLPVESFEDWLRQLAGGGPALLGAVTAFFPAHRLERIELDETTGVVEGLADRIRRTTGRDPVAELAPPSKS
ncbi:MAG: hypothetical protein V1750_09270 [Acidobacteriota bacterium]